MIPLRDTIRSKSTPVVNYVLIATSIVVFLYEMTLSDQSTIDFMMTYGIIPERIHSTLLQGTFSIGATLSLFTSMFVHGGWGHLLGNMLYLYVFGDNVEDRLGHKGYLLFYLLCGIGAALAEVIVQGAGSATPLIGASGAIAGVLGAYFLLYPRARVLTLIPLFIYFPIIELKAYFFLGFWFLMQFISGSLSWGSTEAGGVAWWAHAGGFIVGASLLPLFLATRRR